MLEQYLADFPGCLLLVSHDRALLDRLTDCLFIFDGAGGVRAFVGSYDAYREELKAAKGSGSPPQAREERRRPERERKAGLSFKERREYDGLLEEISRLEEERSELEAGFALAVRAPAEAERGVRRYREVAALLEEKLARWEELGARAGEA